MTEFLSSGLVIIGAGGHGRVVASLAQRAGHTVRGFLDRGVEPMGEGFSILGGDEYLDSTLARDIHIAMGLGSRSIRGRRRALCDYVDARGLVAPQLIDPDASVASSVEIGSGAQVLMGARVQHGASIGEWCIVNTAAVIEHDCRIHANAHVAPGAVLCGGVTIGEGAFIGAGSVVKEGVSIGSSATVGLGAVVIHDVSDGQTVVGAPARGINVN
jgi:UDP-perosamine 4-acetyltransferase